MSYRPLETEHRILIEEATHIQACVTCRKTLVLALEGGVTRNHYCSKGKKFHDQWDAVSMTHPAPREFRTSKEDKGWEEYDKHECIGDYRCEVRSGGGDVTMRMYDYRLYRLPHCSLGIKLADDRFEKFGYEPRHG